jgi:hypothetical protein
MTFFNNGSNELDFGRSDAISGVGSNYDIMTYTARGLAFYTNNVYTPKMIISSSGLVGIGITTPAYLLDVSGSTRIVNSLGVGTAPSGVQGEIRATNEITAYYGASDVRLKENVETIKNSLDRLSKIRGVEFDWTDDYIKYRGGEDGYFVRKHQYGVIAQEVAEVFPELVNIRDNGHMVVDYQHFNAVLIEAIKELKAEIDELKRKG